MKKLLLSLSLSLYLSANSLTVYNNIANVDSTIPVDLKKGENIIYLNSFSKKIIPNSTMFSLKEGLILNSKEYNLNKLSSTSLLQYFKGKRVLYKNKPVTIEESNPLLIRDINGSIFLGDKQFIKFDSVPKELRASITLNISSKEDKYSSLHFSYLTNGLTWYSNYSAFLDKHRNIHLKGFYSVENKTGIDFKDTSISFVAGKLNTIKQKRKMIPMVMKSIAPTAKQEKINAYHMYTLPYKVTLRNNTLKDFKFIDADNIYYSSFGEYTLNFSNGTFPFKFKNKIEFLNNSDNNLGIPFPQGDIRFYEKDSIGTYRLVGESHIEDTAKNKRISLSLGTLFDISGKVITTQYKNDSYELSSTQQIIVTNNSDKFKVLKIKYVIPSYKNVVLQDTCAENCEKEVINDFTGTYIIKLPGNSEYSFDREIFISKD